MAKNTATHKNDGKTGKQRIETGAVSEPADDDWNDAGEFDERWLSASPRDKERSRIQRQMRARRELERLRDEKHLRQMVADWPFDE
jgi:hypothetical protein